jgi:hypothetical protein
LIRNRDKDVSKGVKVKIFLLYVAITTGAAISLLNTALASLGL